MIFNPAKDITIEDGSFDLHEVHDDLNSLNVSLVNEKDQIVVLHFEDHLAYRCRNESDALATLKMMRETGVLGHSLYEVSDSNFMKWLEEERTYKIQGARHYCISTLNWIIDVIALSPPVVETQSH